MAALDQRDEPPTDDQYRTLEATAPDEVADAVAAAVDQLLADERGPELERHLDVVFSYRAARCRAGRPTTAQAALDEVVEDYGVAGAAVTIIDADGRTTTVRSGAIVEPAPIASITKVFTAALALRLAEQGKVDLDAPVELDGLADGITLRHLLGHTSGLPYGAGQPFDAAPTCEVGACFAYSDLGYVAAGRALEQATGRSYPELLEAEILGPAGIDGIATGRDLSPVLLRTGPAGALVAPSAELAAFGRALLTGDVLSDGSLAEMQDVEASAALPCPDLERCPRPYGLGLDRTATPYGPAWGHQGSSGAVLRHYQDEDLTIAVVTTEPGSGTRIVDEVMGAQLGSD